jgi:hypothetical protein
MEHKIVQEIPIIANSSYVSTWLAFRGFLPACLPDCLSVCLCSVCVCLCVSVCGGTGDDGRMNCSSDNIAD